MDRLQERYHQVANISRWKDKQTQLLMVNHCWWGIFHHYQYWTFSRKLLILNRISIWQNSFWLQLTRSLEGVTYFDGPTNRSRVIWEDNGFLHPFRFNRSSTGNSMLITFRSEWRLPRTYGFFFRIYCNPPIQGPARSYNTKPEFCLSKSVIKSKVSRRSAPVHFQKDKDWIHPSIELKSKVTKSGLLKTKANLDEYRCSLQILISINIHRVSPLM